MGLTRSGVVRPGWDGVPVATRARPVRARRRDRRGFTLIEVAVALAITVLVVAAVVPLSLSLIDRADARAVADRLSAGVRLATADAARRGAVVTLCARERRGLETDLVMHDSSGPAVEALVDLGVEMPRGWRVEGAEEASGAGGGRSGVGDRAAVSGEEREASETLTPIGSAFPDGRFVCLSVVATTAERGVVVKPASSGSKASAEEAEDAPARLAVQVDALSGRVGLSAVETGKEKVEEPGQAPAPLADAEAARGRSHPAPRPGPASTPVAPPTAASGGALPVKGGGKS